MTTERPTQLKTNHDIAVEFPWTNNLEHSRLIHTLIFPDRPPNAQLRADAKRRAKTSPPRTMAQHVPKRIRVRHRCSAEAHKRANYMARVRQLQDAEEREFLQTEFVCDHIDWRLINVDFAEPGLRDSRSANYGDLSPLEATEYFSYEFFLADHEAYLSSNDSERFGHVSQRYASNSKRDMNHIWRARQAADRLGLKYHEYIAAVMAGYGKDKPSHRFLPRCLSSKKGVAYAAKHVESKG